MAENETAPEPLFVDINPDEQSVTEIPSLCMACHEEVCGVTVMSIRSEFCIKSYNVVKVP